MPQEYPGTPAHQALLEAIVSHYKDDPRIRAVIVFGSLATGTWDQFSDLDLDIGVDDNITIEIGSELAQLCRSLPAGEDALVILDGKDAGDVVLGSLMEFSVRYHHLATTSPNIISAMQVLAGQLDEQTIKAAGAANRSANRSSMAILIHRSIRYGLEVDIAIRRNRLWMAHELLHRIRLLLMELFTVTHGGVRPIPFFEAKADTELQSHLQKMLPTFEPESIRAALNYGLDMLAGDLTLLTNGSVQLNGEQREILNRLRERSRTDPL